MWALERFQTLTSYCCSIVWYERGGQSYTVAAFYGKTGEKAANRVLLDLQRHAKAQAPAVWERA